MGNGVEGGGVKLQEDGQSHCHSRVKDCRFTFTDHHHQSRLKTVIQAGHSGFEISIICIEIKKIKIKIFFFKERMQECYSRCKTVNS